jgi:hypothetical protein
MAGTEILDAWIPRSIVILKGNWKLHSIAFESHSRLIVIESHAFLFSSIRSILIPNSIEILGSGCFCRCELLSSIIFEAHSRLICSESNAFFCSSLQSIEIPRNVQFIDGCAFDFLALSSISLEPGNEKFVPENEIVRSSCFADRESLSSITFESNSQLAQIESRDFYYHCFNQSSFQKMLKFVFHAAFQNVNHFRQSHLNPIHA